MYYELSALSSIQTEFTSEAPPQTDKNRKESISPPQYHLREPGQAETQTRLPAPEAQLMAGRGHRDNSFFSFQQKKERCFSL